jgi:hypothetical protein
MKIVYANADCVVADGLNRYRLQAGQPWDASDPFVKARPDLFSEFPSFVHRTGPAPVETAAKTTGGKRLNG